MNNRQNQRNREIKIEESPVFEEKVEAPQAVEHIVPASFFPHFYAPDIIHKL